MARGLRDGDRALPDLSRWRRAVSAIWDKERRVGDASRVALQDRASRGEFLGDYHDDDNGTGVGVGLATDDGAWKLFGGMTFAAFDDGMEQHDKEQHATKQHNQKEQRDTAQHATEHQTHKVQHDKEQFDNKEQRHKEQRDTCRSEAAAAAAAWRARARAAQEAEEERLAVEAAEAAEAARLAEEERLAREAAEAPAEAPPRRSLLAREASEAVAEHASAQRPGGLEGGRLLLSAVSP
ncbi:unnamed protein product [Prorocentrum cordatum]|uniref:Uncharacterized protein n=1 Tax=Prorocentrum cordatum TaxID=2364126 RepID=A0ABN9W575_9DINO|nr:unnamed protein product [Polarella glacialis]